MALLKTTWLRVAKYTGRKSWCIFTQSNVVKCSLVSGHSTCLVSCELLYRLAEIDRIMGAGVWSSGVPTSSNPAVGVSL
eukprot:1389315-Amphidinium_carterae.1